jgi:hypothetical protein
MKLRHWPQKYFREKNDRMMMYPGTDVIIEKKNLRKIWQKIVVFDSNKNFFAEKVIITLVFEKNSNLFSLKIGKNRRKL